MISKLTGALVHTDLSYLIVDVQGVGYKVFVTGNTVETLRKETQVSLWTHLAVRENALDLYGFSTPEEIRLFELLISVSGIGPKTAIGILNVVSIQTLRRAVVAQSASELTKVSGIGKKNAEKIILELRDKLEDADMAGMSLKEEGDAIEAMQALGYSQKEAREALKKVPTDIVETSDRVKQALKILS